MPSSLLRRTSVVVPPPGAGADWSQVVGDTPEGLEGMGWLLKAVTGTITQGNTQLPQPVLEILDAAGNLLLQSIGSSASQGANSACTYSWAPQLPLSAIDSGHATAPIPGDAFLPSGWVVKTITIGLGANTVWSAISLWVVEAG